MYDWPRFYRSITLALLLPPGQVYAQALHDAMENADSSSVVRIMCSFSSYEMIGLREIYPKSKT